MMPTALPPGRYLSCAFHFFPHAGGQTRALMMRNRILAREGGVRPELLTLGPANDHSERLERLLEQGLLLDDMPLLNIYEHYRDHGWGERRAIGELKDLRPHLVREDTTAAGAPWRNVYQPPGAKRQVFDYLRDDGSAFLRMPKMSNSAQRSWPDPIQQVGANGAVVGELRSAGQFFRRWIRELVSGDERVFLFTDSRFVVPHLVPLRGRRIHLIYVMHNVHVLPPRRWDSETHRVYERVLTRIGGMDAMVTLTERQRDDIAQRRGRTSNMFVVPNPVVMPAAPARPAQRDPRRVTIVARLTYQKQLTHAIRAFQQVVEAVPGARLDIYGEGDSRPRLEAEIESRGLGGAVVLRGFDPRASEALWTSSAFLLTSAFEGYPLATLESMSRGCPLVSYDIKYGPREQIDDGVEGFLVPPGDIALLAGRIIELLSSPALVERMSAAASRRARDFGPEEFLARWESVLNATIAHRPLRTRIDAVELDLSRLRLVSANPLKRRLTRAGDFALGTVTDDRVLELAGSLTLDGRSRKTAFEAVELSLAWVERESGAVTELPLTVKPAAGRRFGLNARVGLPASDARLRLRLVWRNSAWETDVLKLAGGELSRPAER
jgi:poly(glycerol-phosphate) alpha-glucosyltransferase